MKYGDWSLGQIEALLNRLGEENARRLLDCCEAVVQFNPEKLAVITATLSRFPVWKTIKVGTGLKTSGDFRGTLTKKGCKISDWASDLLDRPEFVVADTEAEVELCSATVAELGFTEATRYDAICVRIVELGYDLCEPEDGPQLRLQYPDQPLGEWLRMAMKAICDANRDLSFFSVERDENGLWLNGNYGYAGDLFSPVNRFVFRLRKRPLAV